MFFWIRNIVISIVLIGLAYYLLANQDELFPEEGAIVEEVIGDDTSNTETNPAPEKKAKRKNSAAEGLSRFYANLHGSDDEDGPKIVNNIVYLPDPSGDLIKILEARRMVTRPLRKTWNGTKESRAFRVGETLYQKLSQYAQADGLEVIWWLNRDYVVKDPFRINRNIVKTSHLIGRAIEGHFINGVSSYFCYQQRTLVLIEESIDYLDEECILLSSSYK